MHHCAICDIRSEETELFFISKHGTPKYICEECAALYTTATEERDPDVAEEALNRIYKKVSAIHDLSVLEMLSDTLSTAKARIEAIRAGSYDFSLDEESESEDQLLEIPEELRQDPEEAAEEAAREEAAKKTSVFDHILNWVWVVLAVGFVGVIAYNIVTLFLD